MKRLLCAVAFANLGVFAAPAISFSEDAPKKNRLCDDVNGHPMCSTTESNECFAHAHCQAGGQT